uniref:Peptide Hact-SCRiP1 n=1 Tax=Heliofungia actiniformis TaxID=75303 RepID=SCRP1_HELAT|nr:RecName: Full=Peptide Hact-SCRiP1 [Heliofungia actiniformis]
QSEFCGHDVGECVPPKLVCRPPTHECLHFPCPGYLKCCCYP